MRKRVITKATIETTGLGDIISQLRSTLQLFAMDARERDDKQASDAIQQYAAAIGTLTANLLADVGNRQNNNLH